MRDGRTLHMMPGKDDAEFSIRGRAAWYSPPLREKIVEQGPHWVKQGDKIFEYDIEEALPRTGSRRPAGTYPRSCWPASFA
jgi:hypothetical protein